MTEDRHIRDAAQHDPFSGAATFALKHRLVRAVWQLVWGVFASWTPPPLRPWRILLLRAFGAQVDWRANVYGSARIWYPPNLTMEPFAALGPYANCYNIALIRIGERAVISQGAHLCTGTHLIDIASFQLVAKPIDIGSHAWVAAEAFVGPGVKIGEGAVLGARAVTVKDLAPWEVYAGNPAHQIRKRKRDGQ